MVENKPVKCSHYPVDTLSRYLLGDLAPRRQKRIAQHLASCPHCRQRVHELTAIQAVLRRAPDAAPPRSFVLSAADARAPRRRLWYPVLRAATAAAATLVLILLMGGVLQPGLWTGSAPTPLPVAIAPASTSRPRPTGVNGAPSIAGAPTTAAPAYPQPAESRPHIEATVARPAGAAPTKTPSSPNAALWSATHLSGLALLGVLAGLTCLAYRRERAFFS